MTIANPEITCSTFPGDGAEPQEGHRTPTREDDFDDIDQAFASNERDYPDKGKQKTLQEQLNIISMVSSTKQSPLNGQSDLSAELVLLTILEGVRIGGSFGLAVDLENEKYRIYANKRPTSNKRPSQRQKKLISAQPRISANPHPTPSHTNSNKR